MSAKRAAQLLEAGIWLKVSGDIEGAQRMFFKARDLDPDNPRIQELLAEPATTTSISHLARNANSAPPKVGGSAQLKLPTIEPAVAPRSTLQVHVEPPVQQSPPVAPLPSPMASVPTSNLDSSRGLQPAQPSRSKLEPPPEPPPPAPPPPSPARAPSSTLSAMMPVEETKPTATPLTWGSVPTGIAPPLAPLPPPPVTPPFAGAAAPRGSRAGDELLDFVGSSIEGESDTPADRKHVAGLVKRAKDLMNLDDQTGAMEVLQSAFELAPDDSAVRQLREKNQKALERVFEAKLGAPDQVPRLLLKEDEIIWLNLDHRAGYLLAQIDGTLTFSDLFDISALTRFETAQILARFVDDGVISRG